MTSSGGPRVGRRTAVLAAVGAAAAAAGLSGCVSARGTDPDRTPAAAERRRPRRHSYGDHAAQFGDLYLPDRGRPLATVVLLHGGFWQAQYGLDLAAGLAPDLADRGYAAWNLEYRRVGDGGGWPATFTDVARGIDLLGDLADRTGESLYPTLAIGHSAGGQLAVWAAGRHRLPSGAPGAAPKVRLAAAISQAGVLDLTAAARDGVGGGSVEALLGGPPEAHPRRYAWASPLTRVPIGVPVCCLHSPADALVPIDQSRRYVRAATAAGDHATLVETDGDHFALIDPASPGWRTAVDQLPGLLRPGAHPTHPTHPGGRGHRRPGT